MTWSSSGRPVESIASIHSHTLHTEGNNQSIYCDLATIFAFNLHPFIWACEPWTQPRMCTDEIIVILWLLIRENYVNNFRPWFTALPLTLYWRFFVAADLKESQFAILRILLPRVWRVRWISIVSPLVSRLSFSSIAVFHVKATACKNYTFFANIHLTSFPPLATNFHRGAVFFSGAFSRVNFTFTRRISIQRTINMRLTPAHKLSIDSERWFNCTYVAHMQLAHATRSEFFSFAFTLLHSDMRCRRRQHTSEAHFSAKLACNRRQVVHTLNWRSCAAIPPRRY